MHVFSTTNGLSILVTGIAQLVFAHLQIDAADHPVRSVTRLTLIITYRPMDDLCLLELLGLFLMTLNTSFPHKRHRHPLLTRESTANDDPNH